MKPQCNT
ncbi:hypothetical protein MAR_001542 [Mya arenaria]|nr:hypothetical protein MAR_001542 [Mya arenaria]